MRRSETQSINRAVKDYLKKFNIDEKIKEVHVINNWENFVGKSVARATTNIYIKDNKLFIYTNSSIVRNELLMIKDGLIKRINDFAESSVIRDVIVR